MAAEPSSIDDFMDRCVPVDADAKATLQVLIEVQHEYGFIPPDAIDRLSKRLGVTRARVQGLISFYSFLSTDGPYRYRLLISDNITDRFTGNQRLYQQLRTALQHEPARIDFTSCLGMSDQGVGMLVNGLAISDVDLARVEEIIDLVRKRIEVSAWPQAWFEVRDNIRRRDQQLQMPTDPGAGLRRLLRHDEEWLLGQLESSGLRGRGGAGFPSARKWRICRDTAADRHYVVCNADEGEPGTFKDRVLLHSYPHDVIEGMTLCARVIGANKGFIYLRGEYRYLLPALRSVMQERQNMGLLGSRILGIEGFDFDIDIHLGAGAYICGEESALIESLEGKRGVPRVRPPFPVQKGYDDQPTVVNNVETFWSACHIGIMGADWFRAAGTSQSAGTRLISISGDCMRPGVYEYPFGTSIRQILLDCGGASAQAVQISGAAGNMVFAEEFDRVLSFEDIPTGGSFMVFGPQRSIVEALANFAAFFRHESCGFCTPCRNGCFRIHEFMNRLSGDLVNQSDLADFRRMLELMTRSSFCGLGCSAPTAFLDVLAKRPEILAERVVATQGDPVFDLEAQLSESRQLISASNRRGGEHG